jgi:hypothetical protein
MIKFFDFQEEKYGEEITKILNVLIIRKKI